MVNNNHQTRNIIILWRDKCIPIHIRKIRMIRVYVKQIDHKILKNKY